MPDEITIVIPTYKEEENIPDLIDRIRKATEGIVKCHILIVDDSDNFDTLKAAGKKKVKVIHRQEKLGLSSAVIEGIIHATTDKVIVMDADLQHPPEALPDLIKALETNDFVVMSRYIPGGDCQEWDLDRKIISRVANLAARPITKVKDAVSGFFGFDKKGLPDLKVLNPRGFKIMLELLAKGKWASIVEVPFTFGIRTRGETKMRFEQVRDYLIQLASLYWYKVRRISKFMAVGASGTVISLGILWSLTELAGWHYMWSYTVSFVVSVITNYIMNSIWTFNDKQSHFKGLGKYALVSTLTLGFRQLLLFVFTDIFGIWYMLSALVIIFIAFGINFGLSRKYVWNKSKIEVKL